MRPQDSHSFPQTDSSRAAPRSALRLRIVLLATSALVSAALPTTVAHAGNATWLAAPADGDFNNGLNWSGGVAPDGTATFGTRYTPNVRFTQSTQLGGLTLTSGAGDYTFDLNGKLMLTGFGLSVQTGASLTLNNSLNNELAFAGTATAGTAHINNFGGIFFEQSNTAAQSVIINHGFLNFEETSTAGSARILSFGLWRYLLF